MGPWGEHVQAGWVPPSPQQGVEQFDVTELVLSETYHKEDLSEVSGQFDIPVLVRLKAVRDDDLTAYFTCNKQTQCLFIRILFCLIACQQNTLYTQQWRIQDFWNGGGGKGGPKPIICENERKYTERGPHPYRPLPLYPPMHSDRFWGCMERFPLLCGPRFLFLLFSRFERFGTRYLCILMISRPIWRAVIGKYLICFS